jgi:hypothetical protein
MEITTEQQGRRFYAGQLRTPDQIERRRAWKRQHNDNAKRIFVCSLYIGMEHAFPYPREVVEATVGARIGGLWAEFKAKQAAERAAFNETLPARLAEFSALPEAERQAVLNAPLCAVTLVHGRAA